VSQSAGKVVFCVTCRNRTAHLKQTLPQNVADNPGAVFVVLDYGSEDELVSWLAEDFAAEIRAGSVVVYSTPADRFRMAHAKNMAHRAAIAEGGEILVNLDADNFTGPGFARYLKKMFEIYGPQTFMWGRMVQRCNAVCDGGVCILPRGHVIVHTASQEILDWVYPEGERPLIRGISGRVVITKEAFLKTGGYDEAKYNDWGPDDKDLNIRLKLLGYVPREINAKFLGAIHHSEKLRFKEYPHAQPASDCMEQIVDVDPVSAVVNMGAYGCGHGWRVYGVCQNLISSGGYRFEPLPTRIFGIGMHKTGTTSLHGALKILGYDSAHWTTPRWARDVWEEMRQHGRSPTLEKSYAACDLPITLLYRELDKAYPGSKFILTVRDEVDWLRSVQAHWGKHNQWRSSWDNDCFTHRMHQIVYGMREFDAVTFLQRYRQHNAEVREYFKDRPGDLMEMPIGSGWETLCGFLGNEIPAVEYPRMNVLRRMG
jgi:GT2 family glycosyltransferase